MFTDGDRDRATLLLAICTIALLYAVAAELTKSHFYRSADR